MPDNILEPEYLELCKEFPLFEKVGHRGFGVKTWLIFKALNEGFVNASSVASNPCQSLMENNVSLNEIKGYLDELKASEVFQLETGLGRYVLRAENSYELHRICYELGKKIGNNANEIKHYLIDCGYTYNDRNMKLVNKFTAGDVNAKTETLKDLLAQLAFAGARLLVKIVVKMEDKVE